MSDRTSDERIWMQWLEEELQNDEPSDCDSDLCDGYASEDRVDGETRNTAMEESEEDDVDMEENFNKASEEKSEEDHVDKEENFNEASEESDFYLGKDKTKWNKLPPRPNVKTKSRNIVLRVPGPKGEAKKAKSEIDCINLIIDDRIIDLIVKSTNIYIKKSGRNFPENEIQNLQINVKCVPFLVYFFSLVC